MSDNTSATKRLRSAFKHGKRSSIADVTREFTEVVEHQKWQEEGFESLPHWVLDKNGLAVQDAETTSKWVKGFLKDGFVDQWVQLTACFCGSTASAPIYTRASSSSK